MIRLDLQREPYWLDLGHGVRLRVRPGSTALMLAARAEAHATQAGHGEAAAVRGAVLLKALARLSVLAWEGVGDADGHPAPPTPERIDALLDLWPMADAFERLYLGPALLLGAEKNACGPAPNGTSAAGPNTAPAAPGWIAPAPASSQAPTASAAPTPNIGR